MRPSTSRADERRVLDPVFTATKTLVARAKERRFVTHAKVDDLLESGASAEVVEDTMAMLKDLGISVVPEGDGDGGGDAPARS